MWKQSNDCEMFTRRKSLDDNQRILSNFKKNDQIIGELKSTGRKISTPKSSATSTPKTNSGKKRERPLSPTDNALTDHKRIHMEQNIIEAGCCWRCQHARRNTFKP